jgi:hypothetical protein
MKEIITHFIKCIIFYSILIAIWHYMPWLGVFLLILFTPIFIYEGYKFFKEMHQSNLDDIQEQLNIVQDNWIEDISIKIRDNWDLKSNKVIPYDRWDCRVYIQQDKDGNVLDTEIQECSVRDKRRATRIKKSLLRAVLKTSPLPRPEDETVFTRQIYFDFSKT